MEDFRIARGHGVECVRPVADRLASHSVAYTSSLPVEGGAGLRDRRKVSIYQESPL
jgi:hypothetical protein